MPIIKTNVQNAFDKAIHYDIHAKIQADIAVMTAQYIAANIANKPQNILEIGCGTGFLSKELKKKWPNTQHVYSDLSINMLNRCRQKIDGLFVQNDGEKLCFQQNSFDLIISSLSFQWFETPYLAMANMLSSLKNGGVLCFSTFGNQSFQKWQDIFEQHKIASPLQRLFDVKELQEHFPAMHITEKISHQKASNGLSFLRQLKAIGAATSAQAKPLSYQTLKKAITDFDKTDKSINYHIIFATLKKNL